MKPTFANGAWLAVCLAACGGSSITGAPDGGAPDASQAHQDAPSMEPGDTGARADTPRWLVESAWYSTNDADCDSIDPSRPAVAKPPVTASGSVTMTGGGGGGSPCSFSIHASLAFADLPTEALDADNLDAGFCP